MNKRNFISFIEYLSNNILYGGELNEQNSEQSSGYFFKWGKEK